jgi:hypothetical protein
MLINGMNTLARRASVRDAIPAYGDGYNDFKIIWSSVHTPSGRHYNQKTIKEDLQRLVQTDPTIIRQVVTASGSTKVSYATSGA